MDGFTWSRDPAAEAVASRAVEAVRSAVVGALPRSGYRAVLLVGGYGRGEGGVVWENGRARLHNNLDVLVVATGAWRFARHALEARARRAVEPIAASLGVGIDVGAIADWTLERGPRRVFYYDLCHGHHTLAGDDRYARRHAFSADRIVADDMLALVANRGTLLAINRELVARGRASHGVLAKHAAKAILGYGDGWLWTRGLYHWSYGERLRTIERSSAPRWLIELYATAARWRFEPGTRPLVDGDLASWSDELLDRLEPIHREVIARVDGRFSGWSAHLYPTTIAGRVRSTFGRVPDLARLFPTVAYRTARDAVPLAAQVLDASTEPTALRSAYLRAWGIDGDPNFSTAATAMGLAT